GPSVCCSLVAFCRPPASDPRLFMAVRLIKSSGPEDVTVTSAMPSHRLWSMSADLFLPSGDK
ncbi:hypothetical protein U0070_003185, partial [Myodes glareolus]